MPRRLKSVLSGILTVLAIAAVAFVVRGAVQPETAPAPSVPAGVPVPGVRPATAFSLAAAGSNTIPRGARTIATARARSVRVYARPSAKRGKRLRARVFNGQRIPLTFLVRYRRKGWVKVDLPTRPNQSKGWVRSDTVDLSFTKLRIEIRTKARRIQLLDGKRVVENAKIGVGESLSPTPPGRYFVTDIIRAKQPKGFYGPYALGLSAHSTTYTTFAGGPGQIGIHGTNIPESIGQDVSAGCIRVLNPLIRRLAKRVPLGTPVVIRR